MVVLPNTFIPVFLLYAGQMYFNKIIHFKPVTVMYQIVFYLFQYAALFGKTDIESKFVCYNCLNCWFSTKRLWDSWRWKASGLNLWQIKQVPYSNSKGVGNRFVLNFFYQLIPKFLREHYYTSTSPLISLGNSRSRASCPQQHWSRHDWIFLKTGSVIFSKSSAIPFDGSNIISDFKYLKCRA